MTFEALVKKAKQRAKANPQKVTLAWIDGSDRTYDAGKAVCLCEVRRIAACLMSARCEGDKTLENMLNELIDADNE